MVKKHQKPNPQKGISGGIVDKEMPMDLSNVALYNPVKGVLTAWASRFWKTVGKCVSSSPLAKSLTFE